MSRAPDGPGSKIGDSGDNTEPPPNPAAEPDKGRRKRRPYRRIHNACALSEHDVYTQAEVCRFFEVDDQTVRNWEKEGLPRVKGASRPFYEGSVLKAFHAGRNQAARRPMTLIELFCLGCSAPREAAPGTLRGASRNGPALRFEARCVRCGTQMYRAWSQAANDAHMALEAAQQSLKIAASSKISTASRQTRRAGNLLSDDSLSADCAANEVSVKAISIATHCDSGRASIPQLPKNPHRTPDGHGHTRESYQLALPFGFMPDAEPVS
jgi:hypothetical protein